LLFFSKKHRNSFGEEALMGQELIPFQAQTGPAWMPAREPNFVEIMEWLERWKGIEKLVGLEWDLRPGMAWAVHQVVIENSLYEWRRVHHVKYQLVVRQAKAKIPSRTGIRFLELMTLYQRLGSTSFFATRPRPTLNGKKLEIQLHHLAFA
jgi:hypothetical protein